MRIAQILLAVIASSSNVFGQQPELPSDIAAARAQYEAKKQAAIKPLRSRYMALLESAKQKAADKGEIDVAVLIDEELQRVTPTEDILFAYIWINHEDALEFFPNGRAKQHGPNWIAESWKKSADGKSIIVRYQNGRDVTYAFVDGDLIHPDTTWGKYTKRPKD